MYMKTPATPLVHRGFGFTKTNRVHFPRAALLYPRGPADCVLCSHFHFASRQLGYIYVHDIYVHENTICARYGGLTKKKKRRKKKVHFSLPETAQTHLDTKRKKNCFGFPTYPTRQNQLLSSKNLNYRYRKT
ncbi:unnamed protein product [Ectocarpus sp. 8 AP-2014]